jgi:hypothetical protein
LVVSPMVAVSSRAASGVPPAFTRAKTGRNSSSRLRPNRMRGAHTITVLTSPIDDS